MYIIMYIDFMKNPKKKKLSKRIEMEYVSATEARKDFFNFIDRVKDAPFGATITVSGRPEVVVMSKDEYDGWVETIEIISDPVLMGGIREGIKDIKEGRVHKWEDVKKELDLDDIS